MKKQFITTALTLLSVAFATKSSAQTTDSAQTAAPTTMVTDSALIAREAELQRADSIVCAQEALAAQALKDSLIQAAKDSVDLVALGERQKARELYGEELAWELDMLRDSLLTLPDTTTRLAVAGLIEDFNQKHSRPPYDVSARIRFILDPADNKFFVWPELCLRDTETGQTSHFDNGKLVPADTLINYDKDLTDKELREREFLAQKAGWVLCGIRDGLAFSKKPEVMTLVRNFNEKYSQGKYKVTGYLGTADSNGESTIQIRAVNTELRNEKTYFINTQTLNK